MIICGRIFPLPSLPGTLRKSSARTASLRKSISAENIPQLEIKNLKAGSGTVNILLVRHEQGVAVNVCRRNGRVEVFVRH